MHGGKSDCVESLSIPNAFYALAKYLRGQLVCPGVTDRHATCSAPKLKETYFSSERGLILGGWLDTRAIVDSEWVCKYLEVLGAALGISIDWTLFGVFVVGLTIHLSLERHPRKASTSQRQVYARLAQFIKLRELWLGFLIDTEAPDYRNGDKEYW